MSKNLNKVRDMKHAKYYKMIRADKDVLERIALMYEDLKPELRAEKTYMSSAGWIENGQYLLIFRVELSVWNQMVKNLGLVVNKHVRQKREWRIA